MIEAEKRAEEELMKQAMEMSLKEDQEKRQQIDEEEAEIMKRVIEMSEREERERVLKEKQAEEALKAAALAAQAIKNTTASPI